MKNRAFGNQSGVSLVELLIVLVIISILIVAAVAQFGDAGDRFETQNIARELKVNFERARFDSVKRRPTTINDMSRVVINDDTSFSLTIDADKSGSIETTDTKNISFGGRTDVKIIATGMSFPVTVAFDRKGHISAIDSSGTTVTPTFVICDNCTAGNYLTSSYYIVSVSPTGTVTMLNKGETLPSHLDPTTTNVNSDYEIDPMITVLSGVIPVGTPVSTPTPDPTPIPTATPTPTPTPSATPTPTATPVQNICRRNERPLDTGCSCQTPYRIHSNGQCK
jgi:prepilin-type N-terminal cleavage/methylation domain-containing protein